MHYSLLWERIVGAARIGLCTTDSAVFDECTAYLLDPFSVHTEVRIAHARCGADLDRFRLWVNIELEIVHKLKDSTTTFKVEVVVLLHNESRARHLG